jgi:integrase
MLLRVERGKDRHAMLSPQLLELLRVWWREGRRHSLLLPGGWLFPGRNRSNRCRPANSVVPSTPPPKPLGSRSASRHTRSRYYEVEVSLSRKCH